MTMQPFLTAPGRAINKAMIHTGPVLTLFFTRPSVRPQGPPRCLATSVLDNHLRRHLRRQRETPPRRQRCIFIATMILIIIILSTVVIILTLIAIIMLSSS